MIIIETPKYQIKNCSEHKYDFSLEDLTRLGHKFIQNKIFLTKLPFEIFTFISSNWSELVSAYSSLNSIQIHYNFSRTIDGITPINIVWWGAYNPDILEFYESAFADRLGIKLLGITSNMQFSFLRTTKEEYLVHKDAFLDYILDRVPDQTNNLHKKIYGMFTSGFPKNRIEFRFKTPLMVSDHEVRSLITSNNSTDLTDKKGEQDNDQERKNNNQERKNNSQKRTKSQLLDPKVSFFYDLMRNAYKNVGAISKICKENNEMKEYHEIFDRLVSDPFLKSLFGEERSISNENFQMVGEVLSEFHIDNLILYPGVPYFSVRFHIDKNLLKTKVSLADFLFNTLAFQVPTYKIWNIALGCIDFNFKTNRNKKQGDPLQKEEFIEDDPEIWSENKEENPQ